MDEIEGENLLNSSSQLFGVLGKNLVNIWDIDLAIKLKLKERDNNGKENLKKLKWIIWNLQWIFIAWRQYLWF